MMFHNLVDLPMPHLKTTTFTITTEAFQYPATAVASLNDLSEHTLPQSDILQENYFLLGWIIQIADLDGLTFIRAS